MKNQKSYKYRLLPNLDQRILFEKTFGCSRFIWNQLLAKIKKEFIHNKPNFERKS